jgi:hypothetical protein
LDFGRIIIFVYFTLLTPFIDPKWSWSCNPINNKTHINIWVGDGDLASHTSHALQPIAANCFKHFKTTFTKEKDNNVFDPIIRN